MPRSQALSFAIRTRRGAAIARPSQQLQGHAHRLRSTSARHATTQSTVSTSNLKNRHAATPTFTLTRTLKLFRSVFRPSPLRLALLKRHLTTSPRRPLPPQTLHPPPRPTATFLYTDPLSDATFSSRLTKFVKQRYLSSSRKTQWRKTLRWQLRFHAYFWPMFACLYAVYIGYMQIERERDWPTPREWGFWGRWEGRMGRGVVGRLEERGWGGTGDWAVAGGYLMKCLRRLEDPTTREGRGVRKLEVALGREREQEVADRLDPATLFDDGLGYSEVGLVVADKSYTWRQGYLDVLMSLAKVAEHMDGHCKRKGSDIMKDRLYKWENIPGPQNPRPVPAEWDKQGGHLKVPGIEEVEAAMPGPEAFYLRVLRATGFNRRQRIDAALAWADWCEYKGEGDLSKRLHEIAVETAVEGLPGGQGDGRGEEVVDVKSGVIQVGKDAYVTENLLKATTALGVYRARQGDVSGALPVFLSVLRARRALGVGPGGSQLQGQLQTLGGKAKQQRQPQSGTDALAGWASNLVDFLGNAIMY